jgi:hypothetical protein
MVERWGEIMEEKERKGYARVEKAKRTSRSAGKAQHPSHGSRYPSFR